MRKMTSGASNGSLSSSLGLLKSRASHVEIVPASMCGMTSTLVLCHRQTS